MNRYNIDDIVIVPMASAGASPTPMEAKVVEIRFVYDESGLLTKPEYKLQWEHNGYPVTTKSWIEEQTINVWQGQYEEYRTPVVAGDDLLFD